MRSIGVRSRFNKRKFWNSARRFSIPGILMGSSPGPPLEARIFFEKFTWPDMGGREEKGREKSHKSSIGGVARRRHLVYRMEMLTRRGFSLSLAGAAAAYGQSPAASLAQLSLAEASARIRNGSVAPSQLLAACLDRIGVYNPKLNAYITVTRDHAMEQARQLDAEQKAGRLRGPLHGIPIALKDNIDTAGIRTTAASAVFDDRIPTVDAEVARRLNAAGAILTGKVNLHEFANGGTSATSYFGPVRNPWALDRNPGGSSGGSAAAVSAGMCFGALGTDTGGSIRTPASFCGIVGFKPTYGLVSIRGIIPLTLSLDHCGPMTRTVEDAAMMLNVLAGYDRLDIASVEHAPEDYVAGMKQTAVKPLRIGVPRVPYFDHLDEDVAKCVEGAIAAVAKLTASVKETTLPSTTGVALPGEMYAYHEEFFSKGAGRYQIPTRRNLQNGGAAKAADYVRGRWKLELIRRTIDDAFQNVDLVVLPTRRHTPRTVDLAKEREESDKIRNPELENTGQFNIFGIPTISVPCGFTSGGLPVGLMIAGPRFSESRVLGLARAYEMATEWHKRQPPLTPDMPVPALKKTDS
jgi:aspartyl-tRNA(Asn)/glutamyl-tRNA(Gln) amidotransferase subunit A